MTTHPLTPEAVKGAYDALEAYDEETIRCGGEPHFPDWAKSIVDQARREGLIGAKEEIGE
jgi:hypothetical protein